MNALAVLYVNEHLEDLRSAARQHHLAASLAPRPSLRERLASSFISLRRTLGLDESRSDHPTALALAIPGLTSR